MFNLAKTLFVLTVLTLTVPITAIAQTFELPEARAGEHYRVQIQQVFRDAYRLKLETGSQDAVIQWALENGDLPPGLAVRADGFILGKPDASRDGAFAFRLRAQDTAAKNDTLVLEFVIKLKGGGLRLVKFEGPTLAPLDEPARGPGATSRHRQDVTNDERSGFTEPNAVPQRNAGPVLAWDEPAYSDNDNVPHFTQSQIDLGVSVNLTSRICMLYVEVKDANGKAITGQVRVDNNKALQKLKLNLAKGDNTIVVVPYANKKATGDCAADSELAKFNGSFPDRLRLNVTCDGAACGEAGASATALSGNGKDEEKGNISQNPFSSRNRRFIVGFEQAGAASAESKGQPFLDLFFTTPLPGGRGNRTLDAKEAKANPFARFSLWGNVKLNSTPQQIAALADVTSNAVSAITEGKVNKLTLGFEFVAGPEIRLATAGRTHISFIGGWGAVTPIAPTQATQIFKTPDPASSQAKRFFEKYPGATGKQFIAFTTPERDRFLRQYFAGFRFRTYRYGDDGELLDQFPGMFDVTFGQNEAVTGGTFHKFVVGLEGFYSLPFGERRFLFLFGSAKFKAGGAKTKEAPFILDTAESSVLPTNPNVFLAEPTPSNRDTYRLGFGVDLIEVFKAAAGKKKEEPKD
jgi:hypothetical protein